MHWRSSVSVFLLELLLHFSSFLTDGAFPYDIPTRECGICLNPYVYDDIFVFGCEESHKICYECFADACQAKMNSNEILACAECAHQLSVGEINQLRVPDEEKTRFRDYQNQKTFATYAANTRGVIRCPKEKCSWVVEAEDPNERFQVKCRACRHEFCSLCNQQYHYRTTCQQIPEITQRWVFWCNTGRSILSLSSQPSLSMR